MRATTRMRESVFFRTVPYPTFGSTGAPDESAAIVDTSPTPGYLHLNERVSARVSGQSILGIATAPTGDDAVSFRHFKSTACNAAAPTIGSLGAANSDG